MEAEFLLLNLFSSLCFSSWNPLEQPHMISYPKNSNKLSIWQPKGWISHAVHFCVHFRTSGAGWMELFHDWWVHSQAKGTDHCQNSLFKWILLYFRQLGDNGTLHIFLQRWTTPTLSACQRASLCYFLHHSLCACVIMCRLMRCPLTRCQSAAVPEARL